MTQNDFGNNKNNKEKKNRGFRATARGVIDFRPPSVADYGLPAGGCTRCTLSSTR